MSRAEVEMDFVMMLRQVGIVDKSVLEAMSAISRDHFIDGPFKKHAFQDIAIPISEGQTISQPSIVGKMSQALRVTKSHRVLEVGTGSGYQTAILAKLSRRVFSVERYRKLARVASVRLNELGISNASILTGDGALGLPDQAPFDRIIVTAAAEDIPSLLLEQLQFGGRMVLPVGQAEAAQTLLQVTKTWKGAEFEELGEVRFVPLLEGRAEG